MKLELTNQEFRTLAKMLDMAHWITESLTDSSNRHELIHEKFTSLKEKIYSSGFRDGMPGVEPCESDNGDHVVLDSESGEFTARLLATYSDLEFWDELGRRLAHRDYAKTYMDDPLPADPDTAYADMELLLEKYHKEFEGYGIDRLEIREDDQRP